MDHRWGYLRHLLDNAQALVVAGSPDAALQAVIEAIRLSGLTPDSFPAHRQALSVDELASALEKACILGPSGDHQEATPMGVGL